MRIYGDEKHDAGEVLFLLALCAFVLIGPALIAGGCVARLLGLELGDE